MVLRSKEENFTQAGLLEFAVFYPVFTEQQKDVGKFYLIFGAIRERKARLSDFRLLITFWRAEGECIF